MPFGGIGDSGMGRHPHPEDLVGAHPQGVEHLGIDGVEGASGGHGHHRVVTALQPQRTIGQLGGESGVAPGEALRPKSLWEFEIGVRPIGDCPQHAVCRQPRRVGGAPTLRRPLHGPRPAVAAPSRTSRPTR